jgi:hypothetical protein
VKEDTQKQVQTAQNSDAGKQKENQQSTNAPKNGKAKGGNADGGNTAGKDEAKPPKPKVSKAHDGKGNEPQAPGQTPTPKEAPPTVSGEPTTGSGKTEGAKPTRATKKARKTHKKKGEGSDTPPSSIRWTEAGYAALLAIEAANPEMTRSQIFSNALQMLAGHIAYLPPIQLARLDKETLITMAGVPAKWEAKCKLIIRKITLAELDDEEKAKQVAALETELQHLRDERLILCRLASIPISHDLTTDMDLVIGTLMERQTTSKGFRAAIDNAIQVLSAYKVVPMAPPVAPPVTPDETQS